MERGIFDFYLREPSVFIREKNVGDFAAMTFGKRDGEAIFGHVIRRIPGLGRR